MHIQLLGHYWENKLINKKKMTINQRTKFKAQIFTELCYSALLYRSLCDVRFGDKELHYNNILFI